MLPLIGPSPLDLHQTQTRIVDIFEEASTLDLAKVDRMLEFTVFAHEYAPTRNLNWSAVVAQCAHETNWLQSPVSYSHNNTAGVKLQPGHPDGPGYRSYSSLEEGARDQIDLLAVYTGLWVPGMVDPSRNTRVRNYVYTRLGGRFARDMTDLNGIWAWPGNQYGQNVERVWLRIFDRRG